MKRGWILVSLIWIIPIGSLLGCSYDLHGISSCSSIAQFGRSISFYLVAPGIWLESSISNALSSDPHAGASFPAFVFGIICWLVSLSAVTFHIVKVLVRSTHR